MCFGHRHNPSCFGPISKKEIVERPGELVARASGCSSQLAGGACSPRTAGQLPGAVVAASSHGEAFHAFKLIQLMTLSSSVLLASSTGIQRAKLQGWQKTDMGLGGNGGCQHSTQRLVHVFAKGRLKWQEQTMAMRYGCCLERMPKGRSFLHRVRPDMMYLLSSRLRAVCIVACQVASPKASHA